MNGVDPWRQTDWDWRAAGNFIAGGSGSGLLLITVVTALLGGPVVWPTLLSLGLVVIGLGLVWMELGRPWRFLHVFFNPHTSWMTREAIVAVPLLVFGLAGVLTAQPSWLWAAALVGMVFLYCQGRILIAAKGIPVWRAPRMMGLIVTSGIVEGSGIYLLFAPWLAPEMIATTSALAWALLVFIACRFVAWQAYLGSLRGNAPIASLDVLNRSSSVFTTLGHILPVLAIICGLLFPSTWPVCGFVAGLSAASAGWFIKTIIITRAAYNQGYAIEHTPARGGGQPGPGTKPGWE